ncbi:hypothetical protein J7E81_01480 [Bacillus sp. ISL-18]|uniref:hypothetical protein n=1 Tax=Bacillus sp. ISL-18 TaxID=2819118 RepID=UPI001BE63F4F|nr:hypothetical protein [Bacillus sp. ISL-18]MBT2653917.1 hypothetical protein [Bacillus sp. ISL-18]
MSKVNQAKELVIKAQELRGNRSAFLREVAEPIRKEFNKIKLDSQLSTPGQFNKIKELKEKETKVFMQKISLRKQAYQHYLNKAKTLAKETVDKSFVTADDSTRAKFQREFAELKFKMALKDEKSSFDEMKTFVGKIPDAAYASLVMENFHEIAGKFNAGELKIGLSKTFDQLKSEFTPPEVVEAFDIIETVDASINNKMFTMTMPGDLPNIEESLIQELFTPEAYRYYQEPEVYFEKMDEKAPVFVDPEEKVEKQKSRVDQAYDNLDAIMKEKRESGELNLGGNQ